MLSQAHLKTFILGGSSLVGRHLAARLGKKLGFVTYNGKPVAGGFHFDARCMSPTILAEAAGGCSHAVILFANTSPDDCAKNRPAAHYLNVDATKAIIDQLDCWGIVPVFTSTEAVFDGTRGGYNETDPVAPLMTYAEQKVAVERYLEARGRPYLVLRLARVVTSTPDDTTLFSQWLRQIRENQDIQCATDHVFSPIHVEDLAEAITMLIDGRHTGLFHIAGPDGLDRLSMLRCLVNSWRAAGRDFTGKVIPRLMADFPTIEPRPHNISLLIDKLVSTTGFFPKGIETMCRDLVYASLKQGKT